GVRHRGGGGGAVGGRVGRGGGACCGGVGGVPGVLRADRVRHAKQSSPVPLYDGPRPPRPAHIPAPPTRFASCTYLARRTRLAHLTRLTRPHHAPYLSPRHTYTSRS